MWAMPVRGSPAPGATARIDSERDRIEHELDVADAFASVRAQCLRQRLGLRRRPAASRPWAGSPWSRPAPPGSRTRTATVRSTSPGSRPTSRQASSTSARSGATPDAALPVSSYQPFHASACGHRRAEHPRALRSDHQRRSGRSRPARQQLAVAGLVPAPVEVDRPVAQEAADDRERLLEAIDAVVERVAVGAELGLVPARPEAQHEAAAAQLVDRRGLLGEQRRVVEVRAGDERPELDPRRRGRDRRPAASRPPTGRGPAGPASDRGGARRPTPSRSPGPRSRGSCRGARPSAPRARPRGAGCRP